MKAVIDAGTSIEVLDRSYTTGLRPRGIAILSALTEDERLRIVERTHEGRQLARDNGVKMGRKKHEGETRRALAKGCGISRSARS